MHSPGQVAVYMGSQVGLCAGRITTGHHPTHGHSLVGQRHMTEAELPGNGSHSELVLRTGVAVGQDHGNGWDTLITGIWEGLSYCHLINGTHLQILGAGHTLQLFPAVICVDILHKIKLGIIYHLYLLSSQRSACFGTMRQSTSTTDLYRFAGLRMFRSKIFGLAWLPM